VSLLEEWRGKKGKKPTPQPLKTTKPPFPCNSTNNLLKSYCTCPPPPPSLPSSKRTPVIPLSKGFSPLQKGRKSLWR